jgi:hypothetical protein
VPVYQGGATSGDPGYDPVEVTVGQIYQGGAVHGPGYTAPSDLHDHEIDTTDVHGIEDTEDLVLKEEAKGFVNHGSNASTPRPIGFASIEWYGEVEPLNAIDGDTWIDTTV